MPSYDAQTRHGYDKDTPGTRVLHVKSEVSGTIQHDMLPILKYLCIIGVEMLVGVYMEKKGPSKWSKV